MAKRLIALVIALWLGVSTLALADDVKVPDSAAPITGMASDLARGVTWVTKDTSNVVSAIGPTGEVLGEVRYEGQPKSVQALAMADRQLYVGDIGTSRETVAIYRVSQLGYGDAPADKFEFKYPDGAHEARALMVSPKRNVYIVTADGNFYRGSYPYSRNMTRLERVKGAPALTGITDGAFTPDGASLVLRTLDQVIVLDAYTFETKGSAYVLPQAKGQALTLSPDARSVVLADANQLITEPIPTKVDPTRPTPTTTPVPTATAPANDGPEAPESPNATSGSRPMGGTLIALISAAVLSLIAALVVMIKR